MRSHLPSGTFTFVFTDVEGSTKLLNELGAEAYASALAEHRRVIRDACAAHGGVEVDTQGDACHACRARARYFARCADLRWPDLLGGTGWREVVQLEHENFHAAHDWALAHGDADTALAIGSGVWPFWMSHYARQSRRWLEEALALGGPRSERRAHVLVGLADFAKFQGDFAAAEQASSEALAIFRARGERRWEAAAISTLADLALMRDDIPTARRLAEKSVSLRREIGSFGLGRGLASVAEVAVAEGRLD